MPVVAQYVSGHVKDGKFKVKYAMFRSEAPMPKTTIEVDATGCKTLEEIEAKAHHLYTHVDEGHDLGGAVQEACREGRQVVFEEVSGEPEEGHPPVAAHASVEQAEDDDQDDDLTDLE